MPLRRGISGPVRRKLVSASLDGEALQFLALLDRIDQPVPLTPAAGPSLSGIFRIPALDDTLLAASAAEQIIEAEAGLCGQSPKLLLGGLCIFGLAGRDRGFDTLFE